MPRQTAKSTKRAGKKTVAATEISDKDGRALFRQIDALLMQSGIRARVEQLQLATGQPKELPQPPALAAAGTAEHPTFPQCPPGQIKRRVCFRDANGTIRCEDRCVPL